MRRGNISTCFTFAYTFIDGQTPKSLQGPCVTFVYKTQLEWGRETVTTGKTPYVKQ